MIGQITGEKDEKFIWGGLTRIDSLKGVQSLYHMFEVLYSKLEVQGNIFLFKNVINALLSNREDITCGIKRNNTYSVLTHYR